MPDFDYFVILAEMRTGSNLLEAHINQFSDVHCYGEAFNPHFIGYPNKDEICGIKKHQRDEDPLELIDVIRSHEGIAGFRFFHDHDLRAMEYVMQDPRCAKIVLTRNPIDSYVSWRIARETGQWKLTNVKNAKKTKIEFDSQQFDIYLRRNQEFQLEIQSRLQRSGQTAYYIGYDDLSDIDIINGLGTYLGAEAPIESLPKTLKKQNPQALSDKVSNFEDMEAALASMDRFDLNRTPNFEPRRGGATPTYFAGKSAPLLFMPIKAGPEKAVTQWLADIDQTFPSELQTEFTQRTLKNWLDDTPGKVSFTVVRHPVVRAHAAFCERIMNVGPGSFKSIRNTLKRDFKVPLPDTFPDPDYNADQHREAFLGFLQFVKANLNLQTAIRVDANWASQTAILQGFANIILPDFIVHEDRLAQDLEYLSKIAEVAGSPAITEPTDQYAERLEEIYNDEIEDKVYDIYTRDYLNFGFVDWR